MSPGVHWLIADAEKNPYNLLWVMPAKGECAVSCLTALKLCLVTDFGHHSIDHYRAFLQQVLQGGVTSVQLRAKHYSEDDFYTLATLFKTWLSPFSIPLIINDHVTIAKAIDADGVHLGQEDISPVQARKLLGPTKIIGVSIETMDDLAFANQLTCIDYVAASAVFQSQTKTNCKTIWGLSGLNMMSHASRHPVVAIGGIELHHVEAIFAHGAKGIAVVRALHHALDPRQMATDFITAIDQFNERGEHDVCTN